MKKFGICTEYEIKVREFISKLIAEKGDPVRQSNGISRIEIEWEDERYIWIRPSSSSRGYKFNVIYVDMTIELGKYDKFVKPMLLPDGDVRLF